MGCFRAIKSNYATKDSEKKVSIEKIVNDMSNNHPAYHSIFEDEFFKLTDIGNKHRIRHHELNKIEIIDNNYYDYFFNRCIALIDLSIRYLQKEGAVNE